MVDRLVLFQPGTENRNFFGKNTINSLKSARAHTGNQTIDPNNRKKPNSIDENSEAAKWFDNEIENTLAGPVWNIYVLVNSAVHTRRLNKRFEMRYTAHDREIKSYLSFNSQQFRFCLIFFHLLYVVLCFFLFDYFFFVNPLKNLLLCMNLCRRL